MAWKMFSFWSNDEEENSDHSNENDEEKDKSKPLCILFQNPVRVSNFTPHLAGKPERFRYVERKDERDTSLLSENVFQNNRSVMTFKEKRKQMDGTIGWDLSPRTLLKVLLCF